jgi:xylan 1,4-beta-xylosidase
VQLAQAFEEKNSPLIRLVSYERMGKPGYPTQAQIQQLNAESKLLVPEKRSLTNGKLVIDLPPNALLLVEIPH